MFRPLFYVVAATLLLACDAIVTPVQIDDGATLCLDGAEVVAVHDACGSSCATVNEATCELGSDDLVSTSYNRTPPSGDVCTADCAIITSVCGAPAGDSLTYGGAMVTVADLPACDTVF